MLKLKKESMMDWGKINKIKSFVYNKITNDPFAFYAGTSYGKPEDLLEVVGKTLRTYKDILSVCQNGDYNNSIVFRMKVFPFDKENNNYPLNVNKNLILKSNQPYELHLNRPRNEPLGTDYFLVITGRDLDVIRTNSQLNKFKNIYHTNL